MTAKRTAHPRKQPAKTKVSARAKASTPKPALTEGAVLVILEATASASPGHAGVDPDVRRQLIAAEAYFRAEKRGFAAGHELSDWLAAETEVDSRLNQMRVA
jgi:hypothetical protein